MPACWRKSASSIIRSNRSQPWRQLAAASGLDGVVASPLEVTAIRAAVASEEFPDYDARCPTLGGAANDQKTTYGRRPRHFWRAADYLVVGRPIMRSLPSPVQAAHAKSLRNETTLNLWARLEKVNRIEVRTCNCSSCGVVFAHLRDSHPTVTYHAKGDPGFDTFFLLTVAGPSFSSSRWPRPSWPSARNRRKRHYPFSEAPYFVGERLNTTSLVPSL